MLISVTLTHTHSIKLLALVLLQFINFLFVLDVFCCSSQKKIRWQEPKQNKTRTRLEKKGKKKTKKHKHIKLEIVESYNFENSVLICEFVGFFIGFDFEFFVLWPGKAVENLK